MSQEEITDCCRGQVAKGNLALYAPHQRAVALEVRGSLTHRCEDVRLIIVLDKPRRRIIPCVGGVRWGN